MTYRFLADLVVALHFLFILFTISGGLLAYRRRWIAIIHLPAAAWAVLIEFFGWRCPLTPLENWLRVKGGVAGYQTTFIEHYLLPVIYPTALTRRLQIVLGFSVVALNAVIYGLLFLRLMKTRPKRNLRKEFRPFRRR